VLIVGVYTLHQNPLDHLLMRHNIKFLEQHSQKRWEQSPALEGP
jgi:hypothetical protein